MGIASHRPSPHVRDSASRRGPGAGFCLGASLAIGSAAACGGGNAARPPQPSPASEQPAAKDGQQSADAPVCFQMRSTPAGGDVRELLLKGTGVWAVTGSYLACRWADGSTSPPSLLRFTSHQGAVQLRMTEWWTRRPCDTVGQVHAQGGRLLLTGSPDEPGIGLQCSPKTTRLNLALDLTRTYAIHGECLYLLDEQEVPLLELTPVDDPDADHVRDMCPAFNDITSWPEYAVARKPTAREVSVAVQMAAVPEHREEGLRHLAAACGAGTTEACVAGLLASRVTVEGAPPGMDDATDAVCAEVMRAFCAGYLPIRAVDRLDLYACMLAGHPCAEQPESPNPERPDSFAWPRESAASTWKLVWVNPRGARMPAHVPIEVTASPGPARQGTLAVSPAGVAWEPVDASAGPPGMARAMQLAEWVLAQPGFAERDPVVQGRLRLRRSDSLSVTGPTIAIQKSDGDR